MANQSIQQTPRCAFCESPIKPRTKYVKYCSNNGKCRRLASKHNRYFDKHGVWSETLQHDINRMRNGVKVKVSNEQLHAEVLALRAEVRQLTKTVAALLRNEQRVIRVNGQATAVLG